MSDLFGTQIQVEVRINKTSGKYSVTILDHGEKIGCTEIDSDGDSLHSKIIEYVSGQLGGKETEYDLLLTKQGERELRHDAVTFDPLEEEEEEEEGYNPLDDSGGVDQFDVGYGI